jgi:hypothetical protein
VDDGSWRNARALDWWSSDGDTSDGEAIAAARQLRWGTQMGGGGTLSLSRGWRGLSSRGCRGVVGEERHGTGGRGQFMVRVSSKEADSCEWKKVYQVFVATPYFLGVEIKIIKEIGHTLLLSALILTRARKLDINMSRPS